MNSWARWALGAVMALTCPACAQRPGNLPPPAGGPLPSAALASAGAAGAGGISSGGAPPGGASVVGAPAPELAVVEAVTIPRKVVQGPKNCDRSDPSLVCDCSLGGKYPHLKPLRSQSFEKANQLIRSFVDKSEPSKRCAREGPLWADVAYQATTLPQLISLAITVSKGQGTTSLGSWTEAKYLNVDAETGELVTLDKITDVPERSQIWRMLEQAIKVAENSQDRSLLLGEAKQRCLQRVPDFLVIEDRLPDGQCLRFVQVCPPAAPGGMSSDGVALEVPVAFFQHTRYFPASASIPADLGFLKAFHKFSQPEAVLRHPSVRPKIEKLIGGPRYAFMRRIWNLTGPVAIEDAVLYAEGCQAHNCGGPSATNAIVVVDLKQQTVSVGIREDGAVKTYSETPGKPPKRLLEWAQ
jgi:hypothetical protein